MASTKPKREQQTGENTGTKRSHRKTGSGATTAKRNASPTSINGIQWTPDLIQVALDLAMSQFMGAAARANRQVTLGSTNVFELYGWNFARCSQQYRGRGSANSNATGGGDLSEQSDATPGQPISVEQPRTAAAGR